MPGGKTTSRGAHDLLLVFTVAAFVLEVALVSRGVLLSQPATHLASPGHATLSLTERSVPTLGEHPAATTPQADGVPRRPLISSRVDGGSAFVGTCNSWHNPERDLRFILANLAL